MGVEGVFLSKLALALKLIRNVSRLGAYIYTQELCAAYTVYD